MENGKEVEVGWVPSRDDLARAKARMAERDLHLSEISKIVTDRFQSECNLHNVLIIWQRDVDFRAYVFFVSDNDLEMAKSSGVMASIEQAVYEELERFGRGKQGDVVVGFEWDSDESVQRKFGGDYWMRLR